MKKSLLIVLAMLLGVLTLSAQEYDVLKTINGVLLYSDDSGQWLTRKSWLSKYGNREFREHFDDGSRYDHSEEVNFLRTDIQESVKLMGEGNIVWERVIESDVPHHELKLAARKRMASVIYETEDKIIGGIIEHGFIRDEQGRP